MKKPVIATLNDTWRVIDDPVQWILERRDRKTSAKSTGVYRQALLRLAPRSIVVH